MTLLYLVRHGETDWNLQRRIQGSTDIPLNETGRLQARRTGSLLARRSWDAIISSPLVRAVETATIIADELDLGAPEIVDAIVERAYGEAEGLDDRELARRFPGNTPVAGRESRQDVSARVMPALAAIAENRPGQHLILTTHGGVIRTVLETVAPASEVHRGVRITNGSIHSFRYYDGVFKLLRFNDPIEVASVEPGAEDLVEQNALEGREH
ncbi:phosphatase PhoE [Parafrigoribacterium mesophilum]|uniref:histidine phosphatase family protein n=1 Tax=Parafrigoribacterium mesophilum TaxID=433646 RepID=UPI0031FD22E1